MLVCPVCQTKYDDQLRQRCAKDFTPLEEVKTISSTPSEQIIAGRYRVIRKLGAGGMAVVHLVERLNIGDFAALKLMNQAIASDPESLAQFQMEARLAASASHPNVVQIYDFGITEDKLPYLVMEYLEGPNLSEELRKTGTLSLERALEIFQPICTALTATHASGLIHRDLKPSNVILQQLKWGGEFVKVVDFGIAKALTTAANPADKGAVVGTLGYMSLEQVKGEVLDNRSDIYSLAVIFYELLTGTLPFQANSTPQMLVAMAKEQPRSLKSLRPDIPSRIELILFKSLSKNRADRHASANELAQELMDAANRARPIFIPKASGEITQETFIDRETLKTATIATLNWQGTLGTLNLDFCLGREKEIEFLKENFLQISQGRNLPVVITSDPGAGRSQILLEYQRWAEREGAVILPARFYDYGGSQLAPYQVFLDMLRACLLGHRLPPITQKFNPGDTQKFQDPANTSQLTEMIQDRTGVILPEEAFSSEALSGGSTDKWRVFEAVTEIYKRIARSAPVVFLLDDLHFADSLSLEMLAYIIRNTTGIRLQVIATALVEEVQTKGKALRNWLAKQIGNNNYKEIFISGLPRSEAEILLAAIFGEIEISDSAIDYIWSETQGFPLFLVELLEHLMIAGKIEKVGNKWRANWFGQLEVPPSVNNLVNAKLRRFDQKQLEVFKHAAVIGDEFQFDVLVEALDIDEDELDEVLRQGVAGWILKEQQSASGDFFRFHHSMLRRALYNSMAKANRRKVHSKVAKTIETLQGSKKDRFVGQIAYHYYWGGEWQKAFVPAVRAGEIARKREAFSEAITYFRYGSEAMEQLQANEIKVEATLAGKMHVGLAEALIILNRFEDTEKELARIFELASQEKDIVLRAWGEFLASRYHQARGAMKRAVELAKLGLESIDEAKESVDYELHRRLLQQLGYTLWMSGQMDAAKEPLEKAVAIAEASTDNRPAGWALSYLGLMHCFRGNGTLAMELSEKGLKLLRASGDRVSEMFAWERVGIVYSMLGDQDRALYYFEGGLELARAIGHQHQQALMYIDLGEANRLKNNLVQAEQHYKKALTISRQTERSDVEALCMQNLGLVANSRKQFAEAANLLETALKLFQAQHRGISEAEVYWALAVAQEGLGQEELALENYKDAAKLCNKLSYLDYEWRALLGEGNILASNSQFQEAENVISEAILVIEKMKSQLPEGANLKGFLEEKQPVYDLFQKLKTKLTEI
ncbi:MAG: protein kinase [Acidobacteria bacterium]|nr:protein kinase [Acidobacteriota bacterium]